MTSNIKIRAATSSDREFIFSLSANLADVADLNWHSREAVQTMQDGYIADMFASMFDGSTTPKTFLIAEQTDELNEVHTAQPLGYIHVCERKDDISNEKCATVTLLAVSEIAQEKGIGKLLLQAAEDWAQRQGYRLLHLEVFANNSKAQVFYKNLGFNPEMMTMIKKF